MAAIASLEWRQNVDRDSPSFCPLAKFTQNGCTDTGSVRLAEEGEEGGTVKGGWVFGGNDKVGAGPRKYRF